MPNPIDLDAHKRAAQFVEPPDAVLILIAEIERLREENERLESELQRQERLTIEANESLDRYIESEQELRARIRELTEWRPIEQLTPGPCLYWDTDKHKFSIAWKPERMDLSEISHHRGIHLELPEGRPLPEAPRG